MAGERKIYHVVKFVQDLPSKVAATGRTILLPTPSYYIRKNQHMFKPHEASKLALDLAQKIVGRYSEKNPHHRLRHRQVLQSWSRLYETRWHSYRRWKFSAYVLV